MQSSIVNIVKDLMNLKTALFLFFLILYIWIGINLYTHIETNHGFILGDWLVNYHDGGFKRRGLSGSMFFLLQDLTGLSLKSLVYSFQMFLYLIFFFLMWKILNNKKVSVLYISLILSPLTFFFFINDPGIIGRKEILLYVVFTYFVYLNQQNKYTKNKEYLIYFLLAFSTFLHEIFIFYMPHFLIVLFLFNRKTNVKKYVLLFLSVLIPTIIIFFFGGLTNEGESLVMLSERGINFPSDKLNIFDFSNSLLTSIEKYKSDPISYSLYSISLILGLIHFAFYTKRELTNEYKILSKYFLFAILYSLPLFVLVCDWGRWLQIHFILLLIILSSKLQNINEYNSSFKVKLNTKTIIILAILIPFFFTWRIYHFKYGFNLDGMLYYAVKKLIAIL